jgi:hypothetical protein
MKSLKQLEEEFANVTVRMERPSGAGTLILSRQNTALTISTRSYWFPKTDINGWFDVKVKHGHQTILLHNALLKSQTDHTRKSHETRIFPNMVVFGAQALDKTNSVSSVLFRIEKIGYFFHHHIVEWQSLYKAPKEVLAALKKLRKNKEFPIAYEFFKPDALYLIHRPPLVLSFSAKGFKYEVGWGYSQRGLGWDAAQVRAEPFGIITFPKPVSLDQATDEVWAWKRYFTQVALEHLDITMLSVGGRKRKWRYGDVYLPNNTFRDQLDSGGWSFRKGDAPYSRWVDRKSLEKVMQTWLSKDTKRQIFRVSLDRAIKSASDGESLEDIVTLCSAIESLAELKSAAAISNSEVETLSNAAIKAAKDAKIGIDANRIKGVLSLMKHQSLPQKLKAMFEALSQFIKPEYAKKITTATLELRAIAAHGNPLANFSVPRISPVVRALTCSCVLYDLLTSGVPLKANETFRLRAIRDLEEAVQWMMRLEAQAKSRK